MLNVLCVGRSKSELSIFSWRELTQSGYFYFWHTKTWDILSPTYHRPTHIPTNLPIHPPSWTTRTLSKSDHGDLWIHKHSCLNRVMSRPLGNRRKIYGKTHLKSDPRDLWQFRHLFIVMRREELTNLKRWWQRPRQWRQQRQWQRQS